MKFIIAYLIVGLIVVVPLEIMYALKRSEYRSGDDKKDWISYVGVSIAMVWCVITWPTIVYEIINMIRGPKG